MKFFKQIKFLIVVFLPACLLGMDSSTSSKYFDFPKPTGAYAVGTQVIQLTDTKRNDVETGTPRKLVMQAWYPIAGTLDKPTSLYTYEMLKVLKKQCAESGLAKDQINQLDLIRTYAIPNAQVLKNKSSYPVVVFAHGNATVRGQYSSLCEDIASHGYIVFMVMHTYMTSLTRFEDGTETQILRKPGIQSFLDCPDDIEFMINSAQNGAFKNLTDCCDFKNIGIVGHSLGGIMASHICRQDSRVKAGISLDGPLYGPGAAKPFYKPFMFMIAPTFYEQFGDEGGLAAADMTKDEFAKSLETFCKANGSGSYKVLLKNAEHCTFGDDVLLSGIFKKIFKTDDIKMTTGTIDGIKATEIIRTYICNFFDKYLKGQSSQLLEGKDKKYSDYVEFNSWVK
jgi:dienelactone hydrolase